MPLGLPLSFYIDDRMIIIRKKAPEQQRADSTITGTVVDEKSGEKVIGASVMVKGFRRARAVTDANGSFRMRRIERRGDSSELCWVRKKETAVNGPEMRGEDFSHYGIHAGSGSDRLR